MVARVVTEAAESDPKTRPTADDIVAVLTGRQPRAIVAPRCCRQTPARRLLVVIAAGDNAKLLFVDLVHEPVLGVDAPRPTPLQPVTQRLRQPGSGGLHHRGMGRCIDRQTIT